MLNWQRVIMLNAHFPHSTFRIPRLNMQAGGCVNLNIYCDQWAKSGECGKNIDYMTIYCPKACDRCSLSKWHVWKLITFKYSLVWVYKHRLFKWKFNCSFVLKCVVWPGSDRICMDENRYCAFWAARGDCKTNPDYMLLRCKQSCKKFLISTCEYLIIIIVIMICVSTTI